MLARYLRVFQPGCVAMIVLGVLTPEVRASGISYNVTNLGIRSPVALNDAGQVALNQSTSFGYYDPIYDGTAASARHTSQSSFTHAVLYNSYGPDAGMGFVGQALPSASSDPKHLNSVATLNGVVIAKPEASDIATGLTPSGQVAVTSAAGSFLTDGKTVQPAPPNSANNFKLPDGTSISPAAVNASGQVAGTASTPANNFFEHAVLVTNGKATDLGTLGGLRSTASAINASGQVVGSSQIHPADGSNIDSAPTHAFITTGGVMKDLGTLGGVNITPYAVNAQGMVVGSADPNSTSPSNGPYYYWNSNQLQGQHAFLFDGSKMIDLNSAISDQLNLTLNQAIAINSSGQILAYGRAGYNYLENAYLLTPVGMTTPATPTLAPEPGSLAILGLAVGATWLRRRTIVRKITDRNEKTS